ncbi:odorant receptor 94b-like [Bradysia coprophila]|uniref:odorant receptor 94b-like n=1 Tax=Bradysia coprophila TaxID=38358 RepID=UPI00187D7DE3|nr:odorant receptor 94b-like [Bradysia coprophila]
MHSIQIHEIISRTTFVLCRLGIWYRGDKPTVKDLRKKVFFSIYYSFFVISVSVGVIKSENPDQRIFLADIAIGAVVVVVKFWMLVWKQNEILTLLNRVCVFSIRYDDDYNRFNYRLTGFMKFVFVFAIITMVAGSLVSVGLSVIGSDKTLFLEIGFPLDYKNSDIAFCMATVFLFTEVFLSLIALFFSIMIWYLLFNCSLRYEVLGSELKDMGRTSEKRDAKVTERQMHNNFFEDLKTSIDAHLHLRELTKEVESFLADLFLLQFATSGLCICGSVYCLAFNVGGSLLTSILYLFVFFYHVAELIMITYFGNEIMLSSNRLSYSLFESNWYNQPHSTKKCVIIFGEYLKQPQAMMIGKLYPLTLETFTRILNSAYSMFNILKSF